MQGRRSEIARLSRDFYRNQFRKTMNLLLMIAGIIFIMIIAMIYIILTRPEQTYYANTANGTVLPMPGGQ